VSQQSSGQHTNRPGEVAVLGLYQRTPCSAQVVANHGVATRPTVARLSKPLCRHARRVLEDHEWQLSERQQHYGTNEMSIPVKSVAALVADEMWHPFYVFQYFSVIIWVVGDQYYIYAVCIFLITAFSIITSSLETHQNMKRLAELAHYTCMVRPAAQHAVLCGLCVLKSAAACLLAVSVAALVRDRHTLTVGRAACG
jgi:hypothetical protein